MIKIRVTSPFRYQFINGDGKMAKDIHFAAGDYYHIDPSKEKLEAKFVLSPAFAFKKYIHIDRESVPETLVKEVGLEFGLYDDYTLEVAEEVIPTLIDMSGHFVTDELGDYVEQTYEPKPNRFDLTSDPNATTKDEINEEEFIIEEKSLIGANKFDGALSTPYIEPIVLPNEDKEPIDIESPGLGEKNARKAELEELHYKKVQEIAELYNIEYKNKKETIDEIIDLEFGDPDAEPKNIEL